MKTIINSQEVEVVITKKINNKNTYIRVKEDLKIYVTTNFFTKDKHIEKLIIDNKKSIEKMFLKQIVKKSKDEKFYYLGKKYDIVYLNNKDVIIGDDKIFINHGIDVDKWLLNQANKVFKEELNKMYNIFPVEIPCPSLTIRKMKTRWGVCNTKSIRVTLNLELIKKDIKYLDYVIVHELSHLVYPNHQKDFWSLVEKVVPNYKTLRKELNNYE